MIKIIIILIIKNEIIIIFTERLRLHNFKIRIDLKPSLQSSSTVSNKMLQKLYESNGKTFESILDIPMN